MKIKRLSRRDTIGSDAVSGVVLGVESVPDSLASGLLAGVNPVFGLYGAMWGTFTGALFTSSAFMAVQTTGAMSIIVADVDEVANADDPAAALFTLSIMTGMVMLFLGLAKLGMLLNYVSQSVMIGFISAVGVNIVLGQLDGFTGYEAEGSNRVSRAFDLLFHLGDIEPTTFTVGLTTIVLILVLERTRAGGARHGRCRVRCVGNGSPLRVGGRASAGSRRDSQLVAAPEVPGPRFDPEPDRSGRRPGVHRAGPGCGRVSELPAARRHTG